MNLQIAILESQQIKPAMGEPCNNCGWCCLTEVCPVGLELVDAIIPCKLLRTIGDRHYCSIAYTPAMKRTIGSGCDAKTQMEVITDFNKRLTGTDNA